VGAKADFSADGRYIAFHAPKNSGDGYEIRIVDLRDSTVRVLDGLAGSSLFPSWTRDGRLCFRYEGQDFRGFMLAQGVLALPSLALPRVTKAPEFVTSLSELVDGQISLGAEYSVLLIWAPWNSHSPEALQSFDDVSRRLSNQSLAFGVAADPVSSRYGLAWFLLHHEISTRILTLRPAAVVRTVAMNQLPATMLFRRGRLIDHRLGAQSEEELEEWIRQVVSVEESRNK
jgi:hypothetical protein